jgi:uncharacterized protein
MKLRNYSLFGLLLAGLLLINTHVFAGDIPAKPNPPRLVNDFAGILNQNQVQNLEYQLRYFHDTTSNQIVVVTVKSLNGMDAADFATKLGYQWQVGQKKFDNGIVVLVKPKYGNSRGQAFIAVGYGLEGAIPDATAKMIVENEMISHFKQGDYFGGIQAATRVLEKLASGEISAKGYNKTHEGSSPLAALLPFIIFFLIYLLIRASNARSYSLGKGTSFWTAFMLGSMLGGSRSHSGSWNSFSGGSSGSGFGGGFGGFGGGSFGGGGAGGSW